MVDDKAKSAARGLIRDLARSRCQSAATEARRAGWPHLEPGHDAIYLLSDERNREVAI
jgi:hypothetical protein